MVMDVNWSYGYHFEVYINIEPLSCILEISNTYKLKKKNSFFLMEHTILN